MPPADTPVFQDPEVQRLYGLVQDLANSVLANAEQQGKMLAELAHNRRELVALRTGGIATREALVRVESTLDGLRCELSIARKRIDTMPELAEEIAEQTGRHHLSELHATLAEQKRDSYRVRIEKWDGRIWSVLLAVVVAGIIGCLTYVWQSLRR